MKRVLLILLSVFIFSTLTAQTDTEETVTASKGGFAEVPAAKRPKSVDQKKAALAEQKDAGPDAMQKNRDIILYGKSSEVAALLDELIKNDDPRFSEDIYDLFQETKNSSVKEKVLNYFKSFEDPCIEDYAVDLMNDPYDEKQNVVKAAFEYIAACKTKCATPAIITIIEGENEAYFNDAITTLAEIGGPQEAMFLAEYLDRDDLSIPQRQALMRACGKMHAVETWGLLVEIIENEDENAFVRMYAAEAIGMMKVDKSVDVLVRNYDSVDPNFRQYIIKGLANYPNNKEAVNVVTQGIKDDHWRVQQEAIKACKEMNLTSAMPTLIHRAKNDNEKLIKNECFSTIAYMNTSEGNKFLIEQLLDKKVADTTKAKVVEVLVKENHAGKKEIVMLAEETLADDKRKTLRYAIGKEIAKVSAPEYAGLCEKFLSSKDVQTISLGIDMYKTGKYKNAEAKLRQVAEDPKGNASCKKRASNLLGIDDSDKNAK